MITTTNLQKGVSMTKEEFAKGISYLKKLYLKWDFDLSDMVLLEIWYGKFKDLTNESFIEVIKEYSSSNQFPPSSPFDLLNIIEDCDDVNSAWEKILHIISRSTNNSMFQNIMFKEQPKLYQFTANWNIDLVETDSYGNKCYGYQYGKLFKLEYQKHLDSKKVVKINGVLQAPNKLQIGSNTNTTKLLGGGQC